MASTLLGLTYLPVAVWVTVGFGLLVAYRRSASRTIFRLAAAFLASWALLATTVLIWVLTNGGWPAMERLAIAPLSLFEARFLVVWLWGALGAFLVFFAAFLLSQAVGRGFLAILRPRVLDWPARISRPATSTRLLAFDADRSEAFTFTLLERGGPRFFRRRDVILVSDGLLGCLDPKEWEAVVAHELGHVRELDGRYLTFFRTLARMMRWDPVLAYLADVLTRREEYRADLDAVEVTQHPRALARALYKATLTAGPKPGALPGLLGVGGRRGRRETAERIRRLVQLAESGRFPEELGA
jgi:Zn-dependent protease with chaperone function